MGLTSLFFRRRNRPVSPADAAPRGAAAADSVQQARSRARHRLIGSAVLVAIGIVVFPLIFETEPRPVSPDIPIEIARRESNKSPPREGNALDERSERRAEAMVGAPLALPRSPPPVPPAERSAVITETAAEAGREIPLPAPAASRAVTVRPSPPAPTALPKPPAAPKPAASAAKPAAVAKPAATPPSRPAAEPRTALRTPPPAEAAAVAKPAATPPSRPVAETRSALRTTPPPPAEAPHATAAPGEAARAQSLLEGKDVDEGRTDKADKGEKSDPAGTRYVLQVGAFADPGIAHATRLRVERLGLKTYTHVAQTPAGERTRVRVGPVASRTEADRLHAKLKAAGISAAVLTL